MQALTLPHARVTTQDAVRQSVTMSARLHLLARALLASTFVVVGLQRLASGLEALTGTAPPRATAGLALAALQVLLGALIVSGYRLRWTGGFAAVWLLGDAYWSHPFWLLDGPTFAAQLAHFFKNVAIAGGFLLLAFGPQPTRRNGSTP